MSTQRHFWIFFIFMRYIFVLFVYLYTFFNTLLSFFLNWNPLEAYTKREYPPVYPYSRLYRLCSASRLKNKAIFLSHCKKLTKYRPTNVGVSCCPIIFLCGLKTSRISAGCRIRTVANSRQQKTRICLCRWPTLR